MPIMHTAFATEKTGTPQSLQELLQSISVHVSGDSKHLRFKRMYRNDRVAFVYDCVNGFRDTLAQYQEEVLSY